eukprot:gnl/Hemi2/6058_TR2095_c0_g1_i1.p1 gnl/Hemi2/6058_TR2095_c0_g1~~gnl/Hemi2/6058_TR2095_c0_g1_i1.p1  ORF type:complete len:205 (-),score=84.92 gnl/Hemi2/6058_TR2095_c0_g1_i1:104-718(-)
MSVIKLHYFPIRGRAEAVRLLMEDAGIRYENNVPAWPEFKSRCAFGQLPMLEHDGLDIVQSNTILQHVGRLANRCGANDTEKTMCNMINDGAEDLRGAYLKLIYQNWDAGKADFLEKTVPASLGYFEAFLSKSSSGHFVGDEFTYCEASLWELLDCVQRLNSDALAAFPLLTAWKAKIAARPRIAAYLASGKRPEQVNGVAGRG